ncbi:SIR2 family protein [uncultured Methylibium sp.]|uniref:SIR2 family protein n=1 Tax=uncultured Methylibium sp. TaxID=381093 RepID=UPI0025D6F498|nr:SIR2 family protein [uncultured Methylibium sp.]
MQDAEATKVRFSFFKGGEDAVAPKGGEDFDWEKGALRVRENLHDALNAKNLAFLFGSGCSSLMVDGTQRGIATMAPLAKEFLGAAPGVDDARFATAAEREALTKHLGFDLNAEEFASNLERLMEVLYSFQFVLMRSASEEMAKGKDAVDSLIDKVTTFVTQKCSEAPFSKGDPAIVSLYQAFYRKLVYRDRTLPRPWVFTTNYDLLSETALDRLGMPYCNGFSGTIERRFNPTTYRYALAEQLDLTSRKWAAVDSFIYLCKLHGSINWIEEGGSLFPIREVPTAAATKGSRVMIYPTPMKQNASFGSPYSDLFREFQGRIVREQSVLFVVGYSFSDEHVNNLIFQALTVPTFRLVAFLPPNAPGVAQKLRSLHDPRIWLIGGAGPKDGTKAHYFDTFVEKFMPESPGDKVDTAVKKVLQELIAQGMKAGPNEGNGHDD